MTDRPGPTAPGTGPIGVDELADLHAGVLEGAEAARLTARVSTDPHARSVLQALDAAVADLAALGAAPVSVRVPADVADRLDAAFPAATTRAALQGAATTRAADPGAAVRAPVLDLAAVRRDRAGRRRRAGAGALAVAAAAAAVVVVGGLLGGPSSTPGSAVAQPLDLGDGRLGSTVLASLGTTDLGPLTDPATLAGCLGANGVPAGAPVLGSTQVVVRGQRGTLLLLTTGRAGAFRALVVGTACSTGNPDVLVDQEIGAR